MNRVATEAGWGYAAGTHIKKLQTVQNKVLRTITGTDIRTRVDHLHEITKTKTLQEIFKERREKFYKQSAEHENPTSTMRYSLLLLLVTSVITFNVLKLLYVSWFPDLMVNLSLGLLTIVLADLLVKLAANVLPRKLLPDLENKAVFITGAGAQELKSGTSSKLHIVPLDVTKEKDVDKAVEYIKATQGDQGIWAVINNAGILSIGETELMTVEIFQRLIEVNTIGSVRVAKAFLPLIRKSKGRLVFTASCAGRATFPGLVPYSMSKHAIVSFIDGLRREMRKWSVTVHGIEPMIYRTPMSILEPYKIFLNQQWLTLPEETRQLYGDSYVDKYMDIINLALTIDCRSNLQEVIDDLIDATVGASPKNHYIPGLTKQFIPKLAQFLNESIMDYIIDLIISIPVSDTSPDTQLHMKFESTGDRTRDLWILLPGTLITEAVEQTYRQHLLPGVTLPGFVDTSVRTSGHWVLVLESNRCVQGTGFESVGGVSRAIG
uniref:Uncharacterized protein n=2 Tax=Timema TaxID=61471 RepID=A0A7R9E941_9NEOP|nr:unnamed protein product [Timema monikensis]